MREGQKEEEDYFQGKVESETEKGGGRWRDGLQGSSWSLMAKCVSSFWSGGGGEDGWMDG